MKTLKTSNIILLAFLLAVIILVVTTIMNSKYIPEFNLKNPVYKEVKFNNSKPYKYLVLNSYRKVRYEIHKGENFKVEVFKDKRYTDNCEVYMKNDTLHIYIFKSGKYTNIYDVPDVKIFIPSGLIKIIANNAFCNISDFQQDTLNILSKSGSAYINIENSRLKVINFQGKNAKLALNKTNKIDEINFTGNGKYTSLELYDILVNKLNINTDSAAIVLSGKAIQYYLKK
jgi:hypothetical protein